VQYLLNQSDSVQYLLDQSDAVQYLLDQSDAVQYLLDQSDAVQYLLDRMPPAFGHGTMIAGIIHLVAPEAVIMPMKAFDAGGTSSLWNLVRAINDAVADGADVINLSFSSASNSKLLNKALQAARSQGVVIVASAGNDDTSTPTFPAALPFVMGVASL